jgi:CheY-like chemotaxis protein
MPADEKRIRTLVIDDAFDFMQAICSFLENLPNVAVIATGCTGRNAIVLAHEWMPDLVLMDIRMPEMTGLEAAFQLTSLCCRGVIQRYDYPIQLQNSRFARRTATATVSKARRIRNPTTPKGSFGHR